MIFAVLGRTFLAALAVVLVATPASAQWRTWLAEDPDGNGAPVLMHGEVAGGPFLQFWCRGYERRVAIVAYDGREDMPVAPAGVTLEIRNDDSGIWSSDGEIYRHHPGWLGVSYRDIDQMLDIAEIVIGAKTGVYVNVIDNETGEITPVTISAAGSTAAGRDFVEKCFGGTTTATPSSPMQSPAPDSAPVDVAGAGEVDQALDDAERIRQQTLDTLAAVPEPGQLPWQYGTSGEPPVFFALGEMIGGGVLGFGCEVSTGAMMLSVSAPPGVQLPARNIGENVLFVAATDFSSYPVGMQVTASQDGITVMTGAGPTIKAILNDIIAGSQKVVVTLADRQGNNASERPVGMNEITTAAMEVWRECRLDLAAQTAAPAAVPTQPAAPQPSAPAFAPTEAEVFYEAGANPRMLLRTLDDFDISISCSAGIAQGIMTFETRDLAALPPFAEGDKALMMISFDEDEPLTLEGVAVAAPAGTVRLQAVDPNAFAYIPAALSMTDAKEATFVMAKPGNADAYKPAWFSINTARDAAAQLLTACGLG